MPALDRILHSEIIGLAWKKILLRLRDGKLMQLMTLKPIQVFDEEMPYVLDGAQMKVDIDAHLENFIQKPIQRAFDILSMDFKSSGAMLSYNISVDVNVRMDYQNMSIYLNNQFANKQYWILDDKIGLLFHEFKLNMKNKQLEVIVPMTIDARYKKLNYSGEAEVFARANIIYDPLNMRIKITDISYVATSEKWILRLVNLFYYKEIVAALEEFLQFDIQDELNEGLELLQKEVERYNDEFTLLSGKASALKLNKIDIHPEGAAANLHIDGRVKLLS